VDDILEKKEIIDACKFGFSSFQSLVNFNLSSLSSRKECDIECGNNENCRKYVWTEKKKNCWLMSEPLMSTDKIGKYEQVECGLNQCNYQVMSCLSWN